MNKLIAIICAAMGIAAFGGNAVVSEVSGEPKIVYKVGYVSYIFDNPETVGSMTFSQAGTVDLLLVGGGGAGGCMIGGGGGAGQMRVLKSFAVEAGVPYEISVGAGGKHAAEPGNVNWFTNGGNGEDSAFGEEKALGGGVGSTYYCGDGGNGGSGGGASGGKATGGYVGNASRYMGLTVSQNEGAQYDELTGLYYYLGGEGAEEGGNRGGSSYDLLAGGGGGAGGQGGEPAKDLSVAGAGGPGKLNWYSGELCWYAAGGGAGGNSDGKLTSGAPGGSNIGGRGGDSWQDGENGIDGTGSGGGGGGFNGSYALVGGDGGCGVVIVRVWFDDLSKLGDFFDFGDDIVYDFVDNRHTYTYYSDGIYEASERVRLVIRRGGEETGLGFVDAGTFIEITASEEDPCTLIIEVEGASEVDEAAVVKSVSGNYERSFYGIYDVYTFTDTEAPASVVFSRAGYVDLMIVGGGGAGGCMLGGGGGAGEVKFVTRYVVNPDTAYSVIVGKGGSPLPTDGLYWHSYAENGENSSFGRLVAVGGGAGASYYCAHGKSGGSGGGAAGGRLTDGYLGNGGTEKNLDALIDENGQYYYRGGDGVAGGGNAGGSTHNLIAAGGGGAGGPGGDSADDRSIAGVGGAGIESDFSGSLRWYAAGGGGGANSDGTSTEAALGGSGIGGMGGGLYEAAGNGVDGTGSGGGGGGWNGQWATLAGCGGSGIVIMRVGEFSEESPDPIGYNGHVLSTTATGVSFGGTIQSLGAGATEARVFAAYGLSPDALVYTNDVAVITDTEDFTGSLDGLSTKTTYYARLYMANDVAGTAVTEVSQLITFTTLGDAFVDYYNGRYGFWQGEMDGSWVDGFAISDEIGRALCDKPYAVHINQHAENTTWNVYGFEGQTVLCGWPQYHTFGYEAWMYMESGKTYVFAANVDDDASVWVEGTRLLRVTGYGEDVPISTLPKGHFSPTTTGWHKIDLYVGNGVGGYGPYPGFIGIGWSNDDGETWNEFVPPANGAKRFFAEVEDACEIVSSALDDGVGTFTVRFTRYAKNPSLAVYWCDEYAGTETNGWTKIENSESGLNGSNFGFFTFDIPEGAEYLRFVATSGAYVFQSKALRVSEIAPSSTLPEAEFVSFGSPALDHMLINANIASCGSCNTCDIIVSYGTSPDMLDSEVTFEGLARGPVELLVNELAPDRTYYVSIHAVNANGEESDETDAARFDTLSGAKIVPSSQNAQNGDDTRFSISITGTDHGQKTFAILYTGADANSLTNTEYCALTDLDRGWSHAVRFPFLDGVVAYKFVVSNELNGVVWMDESDVATCELVDSNIYDWHGANGNWSDSANWTARSGDERATYPHSPLAAAIINCDDLSNPPVVTIDGAFRIMTVYFWPEGAKATLVGSGWDASRLELVNDSAWLGGQLSDGFDLTFSNLTLISPGIVFGKDSTVTFDNARAEFSSETQLHQDNTTLNIINGSYFHHLAAYIGTLGDNVHVVLDNSTIKQDTGGLDLCYASNAGSCRFDIYGENPIIDTWGYGVLSGLDSKPEGVIPEIVFHLPVTGYARPPFSSTDGKDFMGNGLSKQRLKISIADDSPALHRACKISTALIDTPYGIATNLIDLAVPEQYADKTSFEWIADETDETRTAKLIVNAKTTGFIILVR